MALFEWKPVLSVKVESIDAQHKQLIDYMNHFYEAHEKGLFPAAVRHLKNLVAFTVKHFTEEEAMMQRAGYPGLAGHREHHQKLLASVSRLAEEYIVTPNAKTGEHLGRFLKSWLSGHILGVDKDYSPSLVAYHERSHRAAN
jgi:hemerythrin